MRDLWIITKITSFRYENTGAVNRSPEIPRPGSSPDFDHHRSPFPVSQWLRKQLPYTVTASLRILTVFPFHSPAGKHLYATNTLQYFVSRCPHCSNDCRACQPGESALEVLPYHCLSGHRTGCGTARCTPSKRESIQNDRKVVSPLVAAHLLLLCSPYHMNSDRPI